MAIQVPAGDPDALYMDRENLASAQKAADHWAARLTADPKDFTSAYRLAQARYWLGTNGLPEPQRKGALESAIAAARTAIAIDANHLFLADTLADMGRKEEARKQYQAAIDAPFEPDWTPEVGASSSSRSSCYSGGGDHAILRP